MKAVIYARYSSTNQKEISIEGQLRECGAYAERCGYKVIGEYIDRALSGKSDSRPEFQRLIADSKKGQFDIVIVWKLDRFARNRYDSAVYKRQLKKNGVKVVSATEPIGEGSESVLVEAILEATAEMYSLQLAENTMRGMKDTALKGYCTGGTIPLGFKVENKFLIRDDEKAPIIEFIFEEYNRGSTQAEICRACKERGYKTKYGKDFNVNSIASILRNRMYMGDYTYKGEIPRTCPALVSEEVFNSVQARLEINRRQRGRKITNEKVVYSLSGKCFCGKCGEHMTGESASSHGIQHHYYTCHNRKKYKACDKRREHKEELERFVVEKTLQYVLSPAHIDFIAERVCEEYRKEFSFDNIERLERRLATIEIEFDKCTEAMINARSQLMIDKINEKAELLEVQKQDTEIELAKLRIAADIALNPDEVRAWLLSFCNGNIDDLDFQRRIIDVFINSVFVYDDKYVIYFNVKGGEATIPSTPPDISGELENGSHCSCCGDPHVLTA
ncbi:recombinase family protein [Ruminococcus sp.]|uniref:recombinase family protein n=1 Tax=Ruminococcus sp. TaxID=41978 RepID=UPI0025E8AEB2|nr:recombinase family protein [Ruminococcus sp.]MBQ8965887.1 recombinase family protein [Ruminococcus sp.]